MQRKKFFEFRWGVIALSAVQLAACGGGGGGSAGDANTPQAIKSTPENLQVAVHSAVMHGNVKMAGTLLTRSTPTGQEFIDTKNSGFSIGDVFIFQQVGYKIIGIISSADGSQRITTQPAALKEIYSDLNVNVKTNALAYDESGKPITFSQLGLIKRTGMQLGLANPLGAIKKCVQIKGDVSTESASEGNENNFGYEFTAACTLGELLDIDALNFVNISGTFRYSATTEYIIKLAENSNYTVSDSDLGGDLTVKLEAASFSKISELTKNSNKCKSKDGAIECEIEVFKTPEKWIVIGGVPIGLHAGLRIKITINADGTATLTFKNGSVHTAGLINGLEKNERVNKPDSGTSFDPLSFSGELDVYIYGFASATAIGLST